jgi:hypothetical protein
MSSLEALVPEGVDGAAVKAALIEELGVSLQRTT